ncbi:MAG: hypothetical protein CBB68_04220 [Rhodospirillaceae bacterium TMED8]|nr:hypothetical protein [Magnetovibrio sp.]OUT51543.1 MAG: hypothetical protein CBB68_04220 [Rhodospirillaceae bacterium TMED8]
MIKGYDIVSLKRLVLQLGQGTDIRGANNTKAAKRAVRNAISRNNLNIAETLGQPREQMDIQVIIGAPKPETVDKTAVAAVFPYGKIEVQCENGGLEIANPNTNDSTLLVHAAVIVRMEIPKPQLKKDVM